MLALLTQSVERSTRIAYRRRRSQCDLCETLLLFVSLFRTFFLFLNATPVAEDITAIYF